MPVRVAADTSRCVTYVQVTLYRLSALFHAVSVCTAASTPSKTGRRGLWQVLAARGNRLQRLCASQCALLIIDILCLPLLLLLLLSVWRLPSLRRRWAMTAAAAAAAAAPPRAAAPDGAAKVSAASSVVGADGAGQSSTQSWRTLCRILYGGRRLPVGLDADAWAHILCVLLFTR
eukprot:COSAG01_NODE_1601_length_9765_cov_8.340265_6_plen_175_part_00